MINAMVHAFKAIYLRSFVSIPSVICRNTGITPRGSIKVNSEVKHNVMMRLMGLILMVIAVECFISGIRPVLIEILKQAHACS